MKERKDGEKKPRLNKEKRFYLLTAIGCAAALCALIVVAVAATNGNRGTGNDALHSSTASETPVDSSKPDKPQPDKPTVSVPEGMVLPVSSASVSNEYGFFHNQTLNNYYLHTGMDFAAAEGTAVVAVDDGVVESIYKDDVLLGTEITLRHSDGLKSVYRFVTETEGLKVGAQVKKGDTIATVAAANGNEYKDGAHLHFEILQNGKQVDPTLHLTLEEK